MAERSLREVFEERARALARRPEADDAADTEAMVVLTIAGERYGIDAGRVVEVGLADRVTPVPGLPAVWAGLVNVRGIIWPVLDLRAYLGLPAAEDASPRSILVFVSRDEVTIGMFSDAAPELRRVPAGTSRPPIETGDGSSIVGITPDFLSILDVDRLLDDPRVAAQRIGG